MMAEGSGTGLRYKDKVTIVTGGGAGIGKGIVEVFVRHGSNVVLAGRREDVGKAVETSVNATGPGEAMFVRCDATSEDDVKNLVEKTLEKFGKIDCVINNAATVTLGTIDDVTVDGFQFLLSQNVLGPFIVSKYTLPHLRKVKGSVINISSTSGEVGHKTALAYSSTKGAINSFTKTLAIDEAQNGVRVNAICPASIRTELFEKYLTMHKHEEAKKFYSEQMMHLGRNGTVEEVAMACLFFAADATYCTGAILNVSAGCELGYGIKCGMNINFDLIE